ncbi:glutathione S-transferase family protein [Corynebacterium vitaeruminis]|uniref:Glutathione S-transferase n=1 Tax=Corynebacterium vitaeruminis DSM 20294 TaxID=1224164 RepID=W5XXN9_9CORY|nr:glutathione S-transferase C-terminal domain-containing protein [Corynebacterium vitaeruminis]AHI21435.1 glutathione S-transferase [Corynebacterium vitaeruminis DSM 20294]
MGVDKQKADHLAKEVGAKGEFKRQSNRFTAPFAAEAGKYRLIVGKLCPWAHRQLIVREVLGLEDAISVGVVDPIRGERSWEFNLDEGGVDPVLGIHELREAYLAADPDFDGRPTVPAVIDIESGKVVNNDYHELSHYWETTWRPFHAEGAPDLYPERLRAEMDELADFIFHNINNGVYKCGFARTQEAYEEAYHVLFSALDAIEERLGSRRFLLGDRITDVDVRLFVTLVRFDAAYHGAFHCNRQRLTEFPNLWGYARDLYQTKGFGSTTDFDHIKRHYYSIPVVRSQFGITPVGPDESGWLTPHGREALSRTPEKIYYDFKD